MHVHTNERTIAKVCNDMAPNIGQLVQHVSVQDHWKPNISLQNKCVHLSLYVRSKCLSFGLSVQALHKGEEGEDGCRQIPLTNC